MVLYIFVERRMLKPRIKAVCHSLIFMMGTAVGILACHTDLQDLFELKHFAFIFVATAMFSFTQLPGWFSKKSQ